MPTEYTKQVRNPNFRKPSTGIVKNLSQKQRTQNKISENSAWAQQKKIKSYSFHVHTIAKSLTKELNYQQASSPNNKPSNLGIQNWFLILAFDNHNLREFARRGT